MKVKQAFANLPLWQESLDLVKSMYVITGVFPDEEQDLLIKKLRENAIKVSTGISTALKTNSENRTQYLQESLLALFEIDTCLLIAQKLNYLSNDDIEKHCENCENIQMQINALIHKLSK